ncbi:hypothetical protein [Nocardioides sp. L-11A]|uniref:hypothetical protein n=1 Tax=Nocardioides sp. L-11A TaxID=3043848 RepID=UPI00249C207E|nr:hypothetical protein QJ852_06080 [Nocardioides sp. L-11A]
MRRLLTTLAAGLIALSTLSLAETPEASAAAAPGPGTIVYLKGYDVYVAQPDGSGERRLTTDGTAAAPWRSPTGADDGTVVAVHGSVLHRMDQWGTVLNSIDPPDLRDSAGQVTGGAIDKAAVSPDGGLIAYSYSRYSCPPGLACKTRWATTVTAATGLTSPDVYGTTLYGNPSWVTGSRLIVNGKDFDAIQLFELATSTKQWFHDGAHSGEYLQLSDPAVSRDGTLLATLRGDGDQSHIWTYQVEGNVHYGSPPAPPTPVCAADPRGPGYASPTFAPDSSAIAWQESTGIVVKPAPLVCAVQPELAIPGGADPHWTNAALQTVRPTYPAPPGSKGPQTSGGSFTLAVAPKVAGKARVGKVLKVKGLTWSPAPGKVSYQWLRNGKAIKKATRASYRITRKDRGKRVSVRVTASASGLASTSWTSPKTKVRR